MKYEQSRAIELRKQGKTYKEITEIVGISKSTLCGWFKNEEWSKHVRILNTEKQIKVSKEHLLKMNIARASMLEKKYKDVESEAEKEFEVYKDDPLFIAGLMVYAGEGDKTSRYNVRVSNSEFYLHVVFIRFSEKYLNIKREQIKFWLLLYPDHDVQKLIEVWSNKLNLKISNFHKSQIIVGKEKIKKLQYGVGNSIISSVALKKKILKWLELYKKVFS